jgi:hypothetical protein
MSSTQEHVRLRAYELWKLAGTPEGRANEFWFAAENELEYGESEYETAAVDGEAGTFIPAVDEPPTVAIDLGVSEERAA